MNNIVKLKDLFDFYNGVSFTENENDNKIFKVYGSNGAINYSDKFNYENSIIIGRVGAYCGSVQLEKDKFWATDNTIIATPKKPEYINYLFYLLKHMELNKYAGGSAQPLLTQTTLKEVEVNLLDSNIQKEIGNLLINYDNKIKLNLDIVSEINDLMKLLYNYWFTQFDFPYENGKPYKSSGGKMVWNEKLKRDIPEGWEVKNIEELVLYEKGFEPGAKNYSDEFKEGYLPFYRVGELGSGVPIYTPNFDTIRESQIANFGDVLISFDGSIGRISVSVDGVFSSGIQKATSIVEYINDALIYTISKNDYFQQVLDRHATGSIIKHASNSKKYLDLPIDKDIMLEFSKTIKPLFDKIILLEKENLELIKQRDFLLPLLMNGQVTIK